MSTLNLTSADFGDKFKAIQSQITPTVLGYINRSERLKQLIRDYQADDKTANVIVDSAKPGAAKYAAPVVGADGTVEVRGTATFGTDTINTLPRLIDTLSHELGHYAVESPGKVIANARAAAVAAVQAAAAAGDAQARRDAATDYGAACHLTEGYARLDTARIIDEIVANGGLSSTDGSWLLGEDKAYKEYKALEWPAAETSWSAAERERAIAFSLGHSNRENITSTTGQDYRQYCLDAANRVFNLGATTPSGPAPASVLTDQVDASGAWTRNMVTFDAAGNPVLTSWQRSDGSHGIESFNPSDNSRSGTTFKPDGSSTRYADDGRGNVSAGNYDSTGVPTSYSWSGADGAHGTTLFKRDGSVSGTVTQADGTYKRYANDGNGNVVVIDYNRDGQQTGYTWWRADGSRGSEVSDGAGGRTGTVMRRDGSYANYSDDGHGNSSRTLCNAEAGYESLRER